MWKISNRHCAIYIRNYLIESMYNLRDLFDQIDLRNYSRWRNRESNFISLQLERIYCRSLDAANKVFLAMC